MRSCLENDTVIFKQFLSALFGLIDDGTLEYVDSVWSFLRQRPPGPLFHYTDANGLLGILEHKEIWATDALHLNDAQEFKHALSLLQTELIKRTDDDQLEVGKPLESKKLPSSQQAEVILPRLDCRHNQQVFERLIPLCVVE